MYWKQKYIKTEDDVIIVFPELLQHSRFKGFKPVSAGFISIGYSNKQQCTQCTCYGESISLGLKSDPEDSKIAFQQILGNDMDDFEER